MRDTRRSRRWPVLVATLGVLALGVTLATGLGQNETGSGGPATQTRDERAPALAGTTVSGETFDLEALRGHIVVVNVMASWCAPCRTELPLLARTAARWSGLGLRVVGLAMRDDEAELRALLEETGASGLPVITDRTGAEAVRWGATGVPETYVVDRDGRLRVRALGPIDEAWVDRHVVPLLEG